MNRILTLVFLILFARCIPGQVLTFSFTGVVTNEILGYGSSDPALAFLNSPTGSIASGTFTVDLSNFPYQDDSLYGVYNPVNPFVSPNSDSFSLVTQTGTVVIPSISNLLPQNGGARLEYNGSTLVYNNYHIGARTYICTTYPNGVATISIPMVLMSAGCNYPGSGFVGSVGIGSVNFASLIIVDMTSIELVSSGSTTVPTPTFSPLPGTFSAAQSVTISDVRSDAAIYYTTDGTTPATTSNLYSGPIVVSTSQVIRSIASVVTSSTGYATSSVASGTYTIIPSVSPPQLVDPTTVGLVGAIPLQLSGDRNLLATGGRTVQGIAADGTAELLLRIPVFAANDAILVTVLSDQCTDVTQPSTCQTSTSPAHDGGLRSLSQANAPSIEGATAQDAGDANKFAYVIYQAPIDFVRSGFAQDAQDITRSIHFQVTYSSNGTVYGPQFVSLTIVRPPLILLHGYAAGPDTWANFGTIRNDRRATVSIPNYGDPITVKSTTPALGCSGGSCQKTFRESDLGFTYNTPAVAQDIIADLGSFALGYNPTGTTTPLLGLPLPGIPVAVSQVDIIAHSMGGLVARYWSTDPPTAPFRSPDNYQKGYIHKLVTLGTPHYGTPFATATLFSDASCFRDYSAAPPLGLSMFSRYEIGTAVLVDDVVVNGAVGELTGDGIGEQMNPQLLRIKSSAMPVWLVTIGGEAHPGIGIYTAIFTNCRINHPDDPIANRFTPSLYNNLFDPGIYLSERGSDPAQPQPNDGVVPINSALLGNALLGHLCVQTTLPYADNCFDGYAHGGGTSKLIGNVSNLFSNLVDGTLQSFIENILNTSVENTSVWSKR